MNLETSPRLTSHQIAIPAAITTSAASTHGHQLAPDIGSLSPTSRGR